MFETNVIEKRLDKNCTLQIITRKELSQNEYEIDISQPTKNFRKYKFELDPFQKAAVLSIGNQI